MYYVYILASIDNTTPYTGFTSDLARRVWEHKERLVKGFTNKYKVTRLLYYEVGEDRDSMLAREKQIKKYRRFKKERLILTMNPNKRDLYHKIE